MTLAGLRSPAFVGRSAERSRLVAALSAPPTLALVEGEAGIGKSRLLHEALRSREAPGRLLLAGCPPFREPSTLGPLAESLRPYEAVLSRAALSPLCGALRGLFPEWSAWLSGPLEPADGPASARDRIFRALAELLAALDVSTLVVEDAHWADDSTLQFLLFVVARPDNTVGIVLTVRPGEVEDSSPIRLLGTRAAAGAAPVRIELGPLGRAETARLASSMLGAVGVERELADFLQHHSEGLPLAVEESVRLLSDRGQLVRGGAGWRRAGEGGLDVPPTVRDSVLERAERLDGPARAVLRAAAVLADPTPEPLLLDVSELPEAERIGGLSAALGSGLVRQDGDGHVSFHHALAARAVYDDLPEIERRALHGAAGRILEAAGAAQPARLARHFREAGHTEAWVRVAEQAVDLALASGDQAGAFLLIRDLMVHAPVTAHQLARLAERLPFAAFTGPKHYDDLVAVLRATLDDPGLGTRDAAELRLQLARVYLQMEHFTLGREMLVAAAPGLMHRPDDAARAMLFLGLPQGLTGWPADTHLDWLRKADDLIAAEQLGEPGRLPFGLNARLTALLTLGEPAGWAEVAKLPDETDVERDRPTVTIAQLNVGDLAMRWGRYDEARRRLDHAADLAERYGHLRIGDMAAASRIHLDWFTGAWGGLAERAAAMAERADLPPITRAEPVLVGGLLAAARGDTRRAADAYAEVLDTAVSRGGREYLMEPAGALARLHLAEGRVDDAVRVTEQATDAVRALGVWMWATELALARVDALLAGSRSADATELVAAFEAGVEGREAESSTAALLACRGAVAADGGDHAEAVGLYERSASRWSSLGRPFDALLMAERAAEQLRLLGEHERAVAILTDVGAGLRRIGATGEVARVAATLRALGAPAPPRPPGRPSSADVLTPRELETVRLLADGWTNREIAVRLVVSPRTVASHVSSAMHKLDAISRTALAMKAVELGLITDESGTGSGVSSAL